jgi:hypothetical protein
LYAGLGFLDREARSIKVPKGVADHTTNKSVTRREERNEWAGERRVKYVLGKKVPA